MEKVTEFKTFSMAELEAGVPEILNAPKDGGVIQMITLRPTTDERIILEEAEISVENGVEGDNWRTRGSNSMPDKSANPEAKITIMNSRVIEQITQDKSRWHLAGDQFYADMDLSQGNLPAGQQVQLGTAVLEVSALPHNGCAKFVSRFGKDAHKFVNNPFGSQNRFRGVNMKVIKGGVVKKGDIVKKL